MATNVRPWDWSDFLEVAAPNQYRPVVQLEHDQLARGVFVEVEFAPGQIILADVVTGIFGVGGTAAEAIVDFVKALGDHASVLATQPALSPDLKRQLAYLRRHLVS